MFWFAGLGQFWAISGLPGGPSSRICSLKSTDENKHNTHGHFLIFDVYGLNFPHNALVICVHLFSPIFESVFEITCSIDRF